MKRILIFLMSMVAVMTASIAADLSLLRIKGDVRIKDTDGTVTIPKTRAHISESTILLIPQGASVAILNKENNAVYYSTESGGEYTVKNIIRKTRRQAEKTTSAITSRILQNLNGNDEVRKQKGVSYRDQDSDIDYEKSIASLILSNSESKDCKVKISYVADSDSIWHFAIDSDLSTPLYMNIVTVSDDGIPSLMLPLDHSNLLLSGGHLNLDQYLFFGAHPGQIYFLGATHPFDSGIVSMLLRKPPTDEFTPDFAGIFLCRQE